MHHDPFQFSGKKIQRKILQILRVCHMKTPQTIFVSNELFYLNTSVVFSHSCTFLPSFFGDLSTSPPKKRKHSFPHHFAFNRFLYLFCIETVSNAFFCLRVSSIYFTFKMSFPKRLFSTHLPRSQCAQKTKNRRKMNKNKKQEAAHNQHEIKQNLMQYLHEPNETEPKKGRKKLRVIFHV